MLVELIIMIVVVASAMMVSLAKGNDRGGDGVDDEGSR